MELVLSDTEARILRELLSDYLPDLKREVSRTEAREIRHLLVERQELVERVLGLLRAQTARVS